MFRFALHRSSNLSVDTLSMEKLSPVCASQYSALYAYNNSKLCNVIFSRVIDCRLKDKGVRSNSLHPGNLVSTQLSRSWWVYRLLFGLLRPFTKSLVSASIPTVKPDSHQWQALPCQPLSTLVKAWKHLHQLFYKRNCSSVIGQWRHKQLTSFDSSSMLLNRGLVIGQRCAKVKVLLTRPHRITPGRNR